jgi:hypothetical protein
MIALNFPDPAVAERVACDEPRIKVVYLARELHGTTGGAWRALYAMVEPYLTENAVHDMSIQSGRTNSHTVSFCLHFLPHSQPCRV